MYICYCWECKTNGKKYVGITKNTLKQRFDRHCRDARAGSVQLFHKAIRKYGRDAFTGTVLCTVSEKHQIQIKEKYFINKLETLAEQHGYNLTTGGEYPSISKQLRQHLSDMAKKRKPVSDETKRKLSNSLKGNSNRKGKKASKETLAKMAEGQRGRRHTKETIRKRSGENSAVAVKISVNGIVYNTITEAAEKLNIASSTLRNRVHSKNPLYIQYIRIEDSNEDIGS